MRFHPRTATLRAAALVLALAATAWAAPAGKHPLWRVRSGDASLYLLGSIHALPPESYPLAPVLERAFDEAGSLVFECDLAELDAPSLQEEFRRRAVLEGPGLSKRLAPGTWLRLEKALRAGSLDPAPFERLKPWAVAETLAFLKIREAGFSVERGVDRHFFGAARARGKPIIGLEPGRTALDIFEGLTEGEQERLLLEALSEVESGTGELRELYAAWRSGDAEGLARALLAPMAAEPALFRKLLTDRNERWLPKLEALLKKGGAPALVVVGAGHLVGEQGVVETFRKKGYVVEQL